MSAKRPGGHVPDTQPERAALPGGRIESRSPKDLRGHHEAARIPSMTVDSAKALEADIAENGIQVPLDITAAGVVLDGRHRHRAALALDLDQVPVRVIGPDDEVDFMYRMALVRRDLTASQKALMVLDRDDYRALQAEGQRRRQANLRNNPLDEAVLPHRGRSRAIIAARAAVSERTVQDVKRAREHGDPILIERIRTGELTGEKAVREIVRIERHARIGEAPPLPAGTFNVVVADPPWALGVSVQQHYPTMPTAEIAAMDIPAADDAVLFIWVVSSLLPDALEVIEAWGFVPKSTMVWVKPSIGPGNYVRNRHEILVIATRGDHPTPLPKLRTDSVVEAPRGRHSEKPKVFYELIERMYPHATRLELFARGKPRPGWTFWGNEVEQ